MNNEQDMEKIGRIWTAYEDADAETQKRLTDHSFDFHIDDIGSGWEYVRIVFDGNIERNYRVSYIGPTVTDFVRMAMTLGPNDTEQFSWSDEPSYIEYPWLLSRRNDIVYVEAPKIDHGFFLRYNDLKEQIRNGFEHMYKWEIIGID